MRLQIPVDAATVPRIPAIGAAVAEEPGGHGQLPAAAPVSGVEAVSGRAWRALAVAALGTVLVGFNVPRTDTSTNAATQRPPRTPKSERAAASPASTAPRSSAGDSA